MSKPNEGMEELLKVLEKVPFVSSVTRDVGMLKRVVYERRAPRLMLIGESGVRKAVLSDLVGDAKTDNTWTRFEQLTRVVDLLACDGQLRGTHAALNQMLPDVVLVIASASRVDGGIGDLLEATSMAASWIAQNSNGKSHKAKLIPVLVTEEGDVLGDVLLQRFVKQIKESGLRCEPTIEVSGRIGLSEIAEAIAVGVPDCSRIDTIRAFQIATDARRELANELVRSCSTLAVTVALSPVPLSDIAVIAPLQVLMVSALSYLSGRSWDAKSAGEWIGSLGFVGSAGLGFRWGAQQLVKLVPGAGSVISASIAGTGTMALGRAAIRYFLGPPAGLTTLAK